MQKFIGLIKAEHSDIQNKNSNAGLWPQPKTD
jgi:hypothetical protein